VLWVDGPQTIGTTPRWPAADTLYAVDTTVRLTPDGGGSGHVQESIPRGSTGSYRRYIDSVPDFDERRQRLERSLARTFPGAAISSLAWSNLDGTGAPILASYDFSTRSFVRPDGDALVFDGTLYFRAIAETYAQDATRRSPLRIDSMLHERVTVTLTAPEGYALADSSGDVDLSCGGMTLSISVASRGADTVVSRGIDIPYRYVPASDYAEFAACARRISDAQRLLLRWEKR
jgi:hypothetical protein